MLSDWTYSETELSQASRFDSINGDEGCTDWTDSDINLGIDQFLLSDKPSDLDLFTETVVNDDQIYLTLQALAVIDPNSPDFLIAALKARVQLRNLCESLVTSGLTGE